MLVTVMQIRIMRMLVQNPRVPVSVAMRLPGRIVGRMLVLVVDVMYMTVLMLERLMVVFMVVRLSQVQIDADHHEQCPADQSGGRRLAEQRECQSGANEGSRREVS